MLNRSGLFILLFLLACVVENRAHYRRNGSFEAQLKPNGAYRVRTKGRSHTLVEIHIPPVWKDRYVSVSYKQRLVLLHFAWMRRVYICSKMSTLAIIPAASLCGTKLYKSMIPYPLPCTRHTTERRVEYISFCSTISNISWYKFRHSIDTRAFQRVHVMKVRNHVFYVAPGMLSLSYHPYMTSQRVTQIGPVFGKQALSVKKYLSYIFLCVKGDRTGRKAGGEYTTAGGKGYTTASSLFPSSLYSGATAGGGGYMNAQWISSDMKKDCSCTYFSLTRPPPCRKINVAKIIIHRNTLRQTHGTKSFYVQFPMKKSHLSLSYYHDTNAMIYYGKMPPIPIYAQYLALPHFTPILSNSKHSILHIFQTMTIHQPTQCAEVLVMAIVPYMITQFRSIREDEVQLVQFAQTTSNMIHFPTTLQFFMRHDLQHKYITMQKRCKQNWLSSDNVCTGVQKASAQATAEGPQTFALISKLYTKRCYHYEICIMQCMRSLVIVDLYGPPCVINIMVMIEDQHKLLSFATMTKVISVRHQASTISHHIDHLGYDDNTIVIEQL